jgi:hypothetical protein
MPEPTSRTLMFPRSIAVVITAVFIALNSSPAVSAAPISLYWNDVAMNEIRRANSADPNAARMLAIVHIAMYDACTAYDPAAVPMRANGILKRPPEEMTVSNRLEAMSFAAHRTLVALIPSMTQIADAALVALGYDLRQAGSDDAATAPGIGNLAAIAVLASGKIVASQSVVVHAKRSDSSSYRDLGNQSDDWRQVQP